MKSHLAISSDYGEVRRAAAWLRQQLEGSLIQTRVDDFELAAVEALTNVVRHAYREAKGLRIDLDIYQKPQQVDLLIRDRGSAPPDDLLDRPAEDDDDLPLYLAESGRGLMIIRASVDAVALERRDDETILRLSMFVR